MSYRSCYGNPYFDVAGSTLPAPYPVGSTIAIPLPLEIATPIGTAGTIHILDGLTANPTGQYLLPAGTWLYSATLQLSCVNANDLIVDTTILVNYGGIILARSDDGYNTATCEVPGPIFGNGFIASTTAIMPACPIISDGTKILDVSLGCNTATAGDWVFSDGILGNVTQQLVRIA